MRRKALLHGAAYEPATTSLSRSRQTLRRCLKRLLKPISLDATRRKAHLLFAVALLSVLLVLQPLSRLRHSSFDDVRDIQFIADNDHAYITALRNLTSTTLSTRFSVQNASELRQNRTAWDWAYADLQRKEPPPQLTPYRTRLFRELLRDAQYRLRPRLTMARDVSCNYFNDVPSSVPLRFSCMNTSHRCPDGSFALTAAFAPHEGTSVTWEDVVILILVSKGREPFLDAAADTWISRLHPKATLVFARDGKEPTIPTAILERENTLLLELQNLEGLTKLDVKAFTAWNRIHEIYGRKGKKYFLKVDDDTFVFGHNLIRFLNVVEQKFNPMEEPLYFGHPFCGHGDLKALDYAKWCYAGGGAYGLSFEALHIMLTQIKGGCAYFYDYVFKAPDLVPENDTYGGRYEDVMVGRCVRQAKRRGVVRGTSLLACGSFIPYAPLHYYERFGKSKEKMCQKLQGDAITIHNLEPSAIRFLDHFLFEYPLGGGMTPFSPSNQRIQELIDLCTMKGKKMSCDISRISSA